MHALFDSIATSFNQMLGWEMVAVALALAYLLLIMRENPWGWLCALISTAIYTLLFWQVNLLMDSALNIYYMAMAVYGWQQWQKGGVQQAGVRIVRWNIRSHLVALTIIFTATLISGYLLSANTQAAWPYLDSFTTWASVLTTYMVAKKVLENWLYWLVIDAVAMVIYIDRGLYLTALLFLVYLLICLFGWSSWRKTFYSYDSTNS